MDTDVALHHQVVRVTIALVPAHFLALEAVIVMVVVIEIVDTLLIHDLALHPAGGIAHILVLVHLLDLVIDPAHLVHLLARDISVVVVHTLDPVLDLRALVPDLVPDPLPRVKTNI